MFGFIKRLVGGPQEVAISDDPFGRNPKPLPASAPSFTAPPTREARPTVLQRDEIIDARTRIAGYRFAARLPDAPEPPDARATLEVLRASNVAAFAERRLALIPLQARYWFTADFTVLVGPHSAFLLDLPEPMELERWREAAAEIRAAGARVALPGLDIARDAVLLRECADLALLDFTAYSLPNFERVLKTLKSECSHLEIIVENVGSWPERRYCVSQGVAYCMGPFSTARDEEEPAAEISQSRLVLIEMLNLLRRDADLEEIATVAKRDPGVAVKLVTMANSPLLALSQPVSGIDQAVMVLGREQLYRWLSIGLFRAGSGSPRDEILLELALARGRFLELVGRCHHGKAECDELFMVGLLSLLDSLFGVPMTQVVERLHLSEATRAVLLDSTGPWGRYLMLAIAAEKGRVEQVGRLAGLVAIALEDIEAATTEALSWAEDAVRLSQ